MAFWRKNNNRPGNAAVAYPAHMTAGAGPVVAGSAGHVNGTAGWRPMPGSQNPSQQIGAFDGSLLNQYPAYIPGVQLHSGREWGNPNWYTPTALALPPGSTNLQTTTSPNNIMGGQRYGSQFSGPIGPLSARKNQANVVAAQVRQSGLSALQWAQGLSQ